MLKSIFLASTVALMSSQAFAVVVSSDVKCIATDRPGISFSNKDFDGLDMQADMDFLKADKMTVIENSKSRNAIYVQSSNVQLLDDNSANDTNASMSVVHSVGTGTVNMAITDKKTGETKILADVKISCLGEEVASLKTAAEEAN